MKALPSARSRPRLATEENTIDDSPPSWLEVKQLWWFSDGAIMNVDTREHLWRARGLCPRHSWMYFCVENELKYQPLGTAILYEDLLQRAMHVLRARRADRTKRRGLAPCATCFTCDYVVGARGSPPSFTAERDQVERAARTRAWMQGSRDGWQPHTCPQCLPARAGPESVLCRRHLLERGTHEDIVNSAASLAGLVERTHCCVRSMTADGPPRSAETDAGLVEAIAWFAGWPHAFRYL